MVEEKKKKFFVNSKLLEKVRKTDDSTIIKTWARDSIIVPEFLDRKFLVHNGRKCQVVFVKEDMVGCKLGAFVPTRKFPKHPTGKIGGVKQGIKK